jgi:hypothetical protein
VFDGALARQTDQLRPLVRFPVPFSVCKSCCAIRRQPTAGPSRFDVALLSAKLRRRSKKPCLATPSLRFYRLAFTVRAAHAARLQFTVHTGFSSRVIRHGLSFARRSATR